MDRLELLLLQHEIAALLHAEAAALDDMRLRDWLALFTDDVRYEMPVRTMRERSFGVTVSEQMYHFLEDRASLELRVQRLETKHAWAEDPPSRTRRIVGNIRIGAATSDFAEVRSNIIMTRNRGFGGDVEIISAERQDTLRREDGGWKIASRRIIVDQATLGVKNLALFL